MGRNIWKGHQKQSDYIEKQYYLEYNIENKKGGTK